MYNIEYALSKYTDMINNNEYINLDDLSNVEERDKEEFFELVDMINILKDYSNQERFNTLFQKINKKRIELYSYEDVVDFRGSNKDKNIIEMIDRIFNEEFKDE